MSLEYKEQLHSEIKRLRLLVASGEEQCDLLRQTVAIWREAAESRCTKRELSAAQDRVFNLRNKVTPAIAE